MKDKDLCVRACARLISWAEVFALACRLVYNAGGRAPLLLLPLMLPSLWRSHFNKLYPLSGLYTSFLKSCSDVETFPIFENFPLIYLLLSWTWHSKSKPAARGHISISSRRDETKSASFRCSWIMNYNETLQHMPQISAQAFEESFHLQTKHHLHFMSFCCPLK